MSTDNHTASIQNVAETPNEAQQIADALSKVSTIQILFKKVRGRAALAQINAEAYKNSCAMMAMPEVVQLTVMSRFQIKTKEGTNRFSKWIMCQFGEVDPDKTGKKIPALDGKEYPIWVSDKTMAPYFHLYEELWAAGFDQHSGVKDIVDWIMERGGAQKVANARKTRLATAGKPKADELAKTERELFCEEGPAAVIELDDTMLPIPADAATFFTLVVEKRLDGSLVVRGIGEKDATARLNKLANAAYPELKAKREKDQIKANAKAEAIAEIVDETLDLSKPIILTQEMVEKAKALIAAKKNQQAA